MNMKPRVHQRRDNFYSHAIEILLQPHATAPFRGRNESSQWFQNFKSLKRLCRVGKVCHYISNTETQLALDTPPRIAAKLCTYRSLRSPVGLLRTTMGLGTAADASLADQILSSARASLCAHCSSEIPLWNLKHDC
jgi:hypothetical protein